MKTRYQNNCLKIAMATVLIAVIAWLFLGCATKPFFKVVDFSNVRICLTDDPTRYRPLAKPGAKYLGFAMLDQNMIYVKGYRLSNGRIAPDYTTLGHEISCLMRNQDPEIETLYYEKVLED